MSRDRLRLTAGGTRRHAELAGRPVGLVRSARVVWPRLGGSKSGSTPVGGGWVRRPQGGAPRSRASSLGAHWLPPVRPQAPGSSELYHSININMRQFTDFVEACPKHFFTNRATPHQTRRKNPRNSFGLCRCAGRQGRSQGSWGDRTSDFASRDGCPIEHAVGFCALLSKAPVDRTRCYLALEQAKLRTRVLAQKAWELTPPGLAECRLGGGRCGLNPPPGHAYVARGVRPSPPLIPPSQFGANMFAN